MKRNQRLLLFIVALFFLYQNTYSQIDSVKFKNGHLVIGEIKSVDKGVLTIETDYSDSDFLIEWKEVIWLHSQSNFQINLSNGEQYFSSIKSLNDTIALIYSDTNTAIAVNIQKIVYLNPYDDRFRDRFDASIDVGTELAKAQNVRSFTTRSNLSYKADKWSSDMTFNTLLKSQDETEPIRRTDGGINYRFILTGQLYSIFTVSFLSNTEQKLDLRSNTQLGVGLYFIRTNSAYWSGKVGANRNIENYSNETPDRDSWEAYVGTELDLYDIGDFSLKTSMTAYPGLTDTKRFRFDGGLDLKYDLPFDFYIKLGASVNYDNRPAEGASEIDYVLQSGVGWEW